jgi:hypothetical protein
MRWLREAVDRGFINDPLLAKLDPHLESLRGDAEYEALMRQVQQRWQAFERLITPIHHPRCTMV